MADTNDQELGERIRRARMRAGLSQENVAQAVGLDRTAVNRIESGTRKVSALELSDIADSLGVRMATLLHEPVPAVVAHRSSQGLDVVDSKIDLILAQCAADVEFVRSLSGDRTSPLVDVGEMDVPRTNEEAENAASLVRRSAGLDDVQPALELVEVVGRVGLLAFAEDIGPDTADAGSLLLDRGGVALINSHLQVGRRRLALAHELGHYVFADDYTVDWRVESAATAATPVESRMDRFGRSFLLPEAGVRRTWTEQVEQRGHRDAAVVLASEYRVDMATLALRLKDLGLASADVVSAVRGVRTTRADIVELNLNVPPEELEGRVVPREFAREVVRLVRDERISAERGLELLRGTFVPSDLPLPRTRRADEIWKFVS